MIQSNGLRRLRCKRSHQGIIRTPTQHYAGHGEHVFTTPPTIRVGVADCQTAGIAKRDDRGRMIDIHAMWHRRIELTMNDDTDPTLLDVAGAVNVLPAFGGYEVRHAALRQARLPSHAWRSRSTGPCVRRRLAFIPLYC